MAITSSSLFVFLGFVCITGVYGQGKSYPTSSIIKFPSFASVESNHQHLCGGVIIDHSYVITSQTCTYNFDLEQDKVNVRVGMDQRGFRGEAIAVVRLNVSDPGVPNDVAILKLATHMTYRQKVAWSNMALDLLTVGLEGDVPVWVENKIKSPLSSLKMKVMSHADCVAAYQGVTTIDSTKDCLEPVDDTQLVCSVEPGAPFLTDEPAVIAMVSFPASCDSRNLPVVVTRISNCAEFITMVMSRLTEAFEHLLPGN